MTKLYYCLNKLKEINDNDSEYSIGLSQDIELAKEEVRELIYIIDSNDIWLGEKQQDLINKLQDNFDV